MASEFHTNFKPYVPKKGEQYMSPKQLEHFKKILNQLKVELSQDIDRTVHTMQDEATVFADPANAVLKVTTQAGFTGTSKVTVTPQDNDGVSAAVSANLTGTTANPPTGNPAFLGAIPTNLTTAAGDPVTFSVPYTDDFSDPSTVTEHYWTTGGHWRTINGELLSPGVKNNPLWLEAKLPETWPLVL